MLLQAKLALDPKSSMTQWSELFVQTGRSMSRGARDDPETGRTSLGRIAAGTPQRSSIASAFGTPRFSQTNVIGTLGTLMASDDYDLGEKSEATQLVINCASRAGQHQEL
jgi:hypothetical protein